MYESMGDVWLTMFDETGYAAVSEMRLNTIQGAASNPTVSNVVEGGYNSAVVGWLENTGSKIEFHLQSVKFESDFLGWSFHSGGGFS